MPLDVGPLPSLAAAHEITGFAFVGVVARHRPGGRGRGGVDDDGADGRGGRVACPVEGDDRVDVGARHDGRVAVGVGGRRRRRDQRPVAVDAVAGEVRASGVGRRRPGQQRVDRGRGGCGQRGRRWRRRVVDDDLARRGRADVAGGVDGLHRVGLAAGDRRRVGVREPRDRARVDLACRRAARRSGRRRSGRRSTRSRSGRAERRSATCPRPSPASWATSCRTSRRRTCSPRRRCPRRRPPSPRTCRCRSA